MNKRLSQSQVSSLDDDAYRDYMRAELVRARGNAIPRKRSILDVLLTVVFFIGIVLIVLHQNGLFAK